MNWMTIKDRVLEEVLPQIKQAIPSSWTPERLMRAASRELRRDTSSTMGSLLFLAVGVVVGGVVALALAPKSGKELREDVMGKINDIRHKNGKDQTSAEA